MLDSHKWVAPSSLAARSRQASGGTAAAAAAAAGAEAGSEAAGSSAAAAGAPPAALADHAPVAVYANGLLAAFNELRHCAPLSVQAPAAALLQQALHAASAALAHHAAARTLAEAEQRALDAACNAHAATLCPYAAACFDRVYPGGALQLDLAAATRPLTELEEQRGEQAG
jgi:hypothetical protein